jgi:hypothetical protein
MGNSRKIKMRGFIKAVLGFLSVQTFVPERAVRG